MFHLWVTNPTNDATLPVSQIEQGGATEVLLLLKMNSVTQSEKGFCDCPLECDAIKYSYYYVSSKFEPDKMCPSKAGKEDFLMKEFYLDPMPPKLLTRMEMFAYNETDGVHEICKKNIKYKAEVIFR